MGQLGSYILMILVIAVLYAFYWKKTQPVRRAVDRFGLLFMEARDHAVGGSAAVPLTGPGGEGGLRLLPLEDQPAPVRAALARGSGAEMARCDGLLEDTLRELFQAIGTDRHMKSRYYDYLNTFFSLHKLFLQVSAHPDGALTQAEWKDLELYTGNRRKLLNILAQRMSDKGRAALAGQRPEEQPHPTERRGSDETI